MHEWVYVRLNMSCVILSIINLAVLPWQGGPRGDKEGGSGDGKPKKPESGSGDGRPERPEGGSGDGRPERPEGGSGDRGRPERPDVRPPASYLVMFPHPREGGHIVLGGNTVGVSDGVSVSGVGVTVSCLYDISWGEF